MSHNLKPWLEPRLSEYTEKHGRNLTQVETSPGKPLQIPQFITERDTSNPADRDKDVWAKGHDKEHAVLIRFDSAAVNDFEAKLGKGIATYRFGLFRIRKWYWIYTNDYEDGKKQAPDQHKALRMVMHVTDFDYFSSKGTHDFGSSRCKPLDTTIRPWKSRYEKAQKARDIPIAPLHDPLGTSVVDEKAARTMTGFQYHAPKALAPKGGALRAAIDKEDRRIIAQSKAGLGNAVMQARSAKTPPPPAGAISTASRTKSSSTKMLKIKQMMRKAGSSTSPAPSRGDIDKALNALPPPSHTEAEMYEHTIFTNDEDEAMPDTPPPPASNTTSAISASSPTSSPSKLDSIREPVAQTVYQKLLDDLGRRSQQETGAPSEGEPESDMELEVDGKDAPSPTSEAVPVESRVDGEQPRRHDFTRDTLAEQAIHAGERRLQALADRESAHEAQHVEIQHATMLQGVTLKGHLTASSKQRDEKKDGDDTQQRQRIKKKMERLPRFELSSQASEPDYPPEDPIEESEQDTGITSVSGSGSQAAVQRPVQTRTPAASAEQLPKSLSPPLHSQGRQYDPATPEPPPAILDDVDRTVITGKQVLVALFDPESQQTPGDDGAERGATPPLIATSSPREIDFEPEVPGGQPSKTSSRRQSVEEESDDGFEFVSFIGGEEVSSLSPDLTKRENSSQPSASLGRESRHTASASTGGDNEARLSSRREVPAALHSHTATQRARQMFFEMDIDTDGKVHEEDVTAQAAKTMAAEGATNAARRMVAVLDAHIAGETVEAEHTSKDETPDYDVFGPRFTSQPRSNRSAPLSSVAQGSFELDVSRENLEEWTRLESEPPEEVIQNPFQGTEQENDSAISFRLDLLGMTDTQLEGTQSMGSMLPLELTGRAAIRLVTPKAIPAEIVALPKHHQPGTALAGECRLSSPAVPGAGITKQGGMDHALPVPTTGRQSSASLLPPSPNQQAILPRSRSKVDASAAEPTQPESRETTNTSAAAQNQKRKTVETADGKKVKKSRRKPFPADVQAQITQTRDNILDRLVSLGAGIDMEQAIGLWYCCSGDLDVARVIALHQLSILDSDNEQDPSEMPEHVKEAYKSCWKPEDDVTATKDQSRIVNRKAVEVVERWRGPGSCERRKLWLENDPLAHRLRNANPRRYPHNEDAL